MKGKIGEFHSSTIIVFNLFNKNYVEFICAIMKVKIFADSIASKKDTIHY